MPDKKQINLRISESAKQTLIRRAAEEHRSMSSHIEYLIEQDSQGFVRIPIKGVVDDKGNIKYWETPEGIEQSR